MNGSARTAEAQQDDERDDMSRADAITAVHRLLMTQTRGGAADHHRNAVQIVDAVTAAHPARPSADTEKLRRRITQLEQLLMVEQDARDAEARRYEGGDQ